MGLEAYRIGLVFYENIDKETLKNSLEKVGVEVINKDKNGDILLEKRYDEGFIEFMIRELNNKNAIVNLRIAKPNSDQIFFFLFKLLSKLNDLKRISKIKDYEANKDFDLSNTLPIRENFIKLRNKFIKWYPDLPYPIRCEEVFEKYHELHPEEYRTDC